MKASIIEQRLKFPVIIIGIAVIFFVSILLATPAKALSEDNSGGWKNPGGSPEGTYEFRKKAEEKSNSRWTLADWLAQKQSNRMMDLWLGMYTPSPYELIVSGRYESYQLTVDSPVATSAPIAASTNVAFYALALGVEGFYENNWAENFIDDGAMIGLRLAGKHIQNTHLVLNYGYRTKTTSAYSLQQQFAAVDLDIYIERHSGIHGNYRYSIPTTDPVLGATSGRKWEAGLFWNINFVQLYGGWFNELQTTSNPAAQNQTRQGLYSGLKFFF